MANTSTVTPTFGIDHYLVVEGTPTAALNERVNKKLQEGYLVFGTPFIYSGRLCQTVVKYNSAITEILDAAVRRASPFGNMAID